MISKKVQLAYPYLRNPVITDLIVKYEDFVVRLLNIKIISPLDVEQNCPMLDTLLAQRVGHDVRTS